MDPKDASKPPSPPPEKYYDYGPPLPDRPPSSRRGQTNPASRTALDAVALPILSKTSMSSQQLPYAQPPYPQPPASMVEVAPQPTMSTAGSVVAGARSGLSGQGLVMTGPQAPQGYQPPSGAPAGYYNYPPRPADGLTQLPAPLYNDTFQAGDTVASTVSKSDLKAARLSVEQGLGRILDLQRQQKQQLQYGPGAASVPNSTAAAIQEQLRLQTGSVLRDLRHVRRAISGLAKAAENHRFRRWLVGGLLAAFVPLVRRLFRKPAAARNTGTSSTEYAFRKSRALVDRMLSSVSKRSGLASIAFFVFAVLYIFTNEVSLRVARTLGRRLKKLSSKIDRGDEPLNADDIKQLSGWRWRVLLWGQ